jgi:UDP-N-acetylmuramyl pentapeptide phosphotransferase/UDP-N-acetylglucosamine-1-phosphate transferase
MGDTGSLVCGFLVSIFAIKFMQFNFVPNTPIVSVAILIIPVFDTLRVFFIRVINGKSPFSPDRNHIHHLLKEKKFNSLQIVAILLTSNLLFFLLILTISPYFDINVLAFIIVVISVFVFFLLEWLKKS